VEEIEKGDIVGSLGGIIWFNAMILLLNSFNSCKKQV
jgi:hypothetical protein